MPRREKLRGGKEKAAMLQKINEITKYDREMNDGGANVGGVVDFTAKRKHSDSKLGRSVKGKRHDKSRGGKVVVDDSSGDSSDEGSENEQINLSKNGKNKITKEQYTFEFNDMKSDYTESICSMLKISLVVNPSAAYVLANSITDQSIVGTSVVSEGGDDVFGFATVLPTNIVFSKENVSKKNSILNPLVVLLNEFQIKLNSLADKSVKNSFVKYLFDPYHSAASGIMVQCRFTNLPLQLIVDLHKNLNEDIKYALKHRYKLSSLPSSSLTTFDIRHLI